MCVLNLIVCVHLSIQGLNVIDSVLIVKLGEFQDDVNKLLCIAQFFLQLGDLFF